MWFLLHKSTHKRYVVWLKLGILSFFVHVLFLWILFFVYCDGVSHLAFIITSDMARRSIEFRVAIEPIKKKGNALKGHDTSAKTVSPAKKAPAVSIAQQQVGQKKKNTQKQSAMASTEKKPMQKNEKNKQHISAAQKELEHVEMQLIANGQMKGFEQEYGELYQEVASHWAPPPGVPVDCVCTITVTIDHEGFIADMHVDTSSGMLVYDLAARAALSELQFSRLAWGKSITITFTV